MCVPECEYRSVSEGFGPLFGFRESFCRKHGSLRCGDSIELLLQPDGVDGGDVVGSARGIHGEPFGGDGGMALEHDQNGYDRFSRKRTLCDAD